MCPHQDGAFLYTEPQSCLGFWWPLDDCTLENGCLYAVPGSHKLGVHRRLRRKDAPEEGTGVNFETKNGKKLLPVKFNSEFFPLEAPNWDEELKSAVPLQTKKGTLVILHNALIHYSNENNHPTDARHAYSIHVVDGREGVTYPEDNWLQRPKEYPFQEITARYSGTRM